jgi:hypothetical protein
MFLLLRIFWHTQVRIVVGSALHFDFNHATPPPLLYLEVFVCFHSIL